jgi:hypothetical protein
MVARIRSGRNIRGALNYNENKVTQGMAACIYAGNFVRLAEQLTYHEKLQRFEKLNRQNSNVRTNTIHISLNFHADDNLNSEKLTSIACAYMDQIGFGRQPYLVYEHFDAAHHHIHIVSNLVAKGGKRIDIHNIGRKESEFARQKIEDQFDLVRASEKQHTQRSIPNPVDLTKPFYGKSETKKSISNVVSAVMRSYRYTSIPEYNAVLKQFNIVAIQGSEGSRMRLRNGLLYSFLDSKGNQVGIPIKASSLYGKPTMVNLEKQFKLNAALRTPYKDRVKGVIDDILKGPSPKSIQIFIKELIQKGVYPVIRQNAEGRIYGLTYIDNSTRCVFNGSDLGKPYTAKGILERLNEAPRPEALSIPSFSDQRDTATADYQTGHETNAKTSGDLLKDLASAEQLDYSGSNPITRRRRKKRKRRSL